MGISRAGEGAVSDALAPPRMRSTGLCRVKRGDSVLRPVLCQGDRGRDQRIPAAPGQNPGAGAASPEPTVVNMASNRLDGKD